MTCRKLQAEHNVALAKLSREGKGEAATKLRVERMEAADKDELLKEHQDLVGKLKERIRTLIAETDMLRSQAGARLRLSSHH